MDLGCHSLAGADLDVRDGRLPGVTLFQCQCCNVRSRGVISPAPFLWWSHWDAPCSHWKRKTVFQVGRTDIPSRNDSPPSLLCHHVVFWIRGLFAFLALILFP